MSAPIVLPLGSPEWKAVNVAKTALVGSASKNAAFWMGSGQIPTTSREWLSTQREALVVLSGMFGVDEPADGDAAALERIDAALALPALSQEGKG